MLNEKLKDKGLFNEDQAKAEADKATARKTLNRCVKELITVMKCIQLDDTMTKEEMENFILKRMEYYEGIIWPMDGERFGRWLDDQFMNKLIKVLLK